MYTPIVKCKENDLIATGKLTSAGRAFTKPVIEIPPLGDQKKNINDHIFKTAKQINDHVPLGEIFVDVIGINPNLKTSFDTDAVIHCYQLIHDMGRFYTPAYGFQRDEDHNRDQQRWRKLAELIHKMQKGFCFRIDLEDIYDAPDETWSMVIDYGSLLNLPLNQIDILLDLRDISHKDPRELKEIILDFITLNPQVRRYRNLIITGSSALRDLGKIEPESIAKVTRQELYLWAELQQDIGENLILTFGDYGIVHPNFVDGGPNKNMKAKIRYTHKGDIWYFKGHGLLLPIKDYDQYYGLAQKVKDSEFYQGRASSFGDKYLDDVASKYIGPGDPGAWVLADMNHHIEYTAKQIQRITMNVHHFDNVELLDI